MHGGISKKVCLDHFWLWIKKNWIYVHFFSYFTDDELKLEWSDDPDSEDDKEVAKLSRTSSTKKGKQVTIQNPPDGADHDEEEEESNKTKGHSIYIRTAPVVSFAELV